jgi:hypothetical protein
MVKLEDLVKGTLVDGVEPDGPVTVVNVEWNGDDSVEIFYKGVSVPDNVERIVSENCRTLKFVDFEFERG